MNILERLKITDGTNFISIDGENEIELNILNCKQVFCYYTFFNLNENLNLNLDNNSSLNLIGSEYDLKCNFFCKINNLICDSFTIEDFNNTTKSQTNTELFLGYVPNRWMAATFNLGADTTIDFLYQTVVNINTTRQAEITQTTYNDISFDNPDSLTTIFDNIKSFKNPVGELHLE